MTSNAERRENNNLRKILINILLGVSISIFIFWGMIWLSDNRPKYTGAELVSIYDGGSMYQVQYKNRVCFFYVRADLTETQLKDLQKCFVIPTATQP